VSKLNAGSKVVFGASVTLADVETDERRSTRSSVTWRRTSSWA